MDPNAPAQPVPVVVQNNPPSYELAFKQLNDQLANLTSSLASQGVKQVVQIYDGQPKNFREWITSIEKYARLINTDMNVCKMIAYQTSTHAVSGYISRFLDQNPTGTWPALKSELEKRFSDVTDASLALSMLRTIRQQKSESIQTFTERIRSLAEIGFRNQEGPVVQAQLIDIFVQGLSNEQLKLTILRRHPETLEHAVAIATDESNLRQRVLCGRVPDIRQEEPMDVSHMRPVRCFKCHKTGHKAPDCKQVRVVTKPTPVCWRCGQEGHIIRECRSEPKPRPPRGHGRPFNGQPFRPGQTN